MSKKCVKLRYNWRQCGEAGGQWGEDYDTYEVGRDSVGSIHFEPAISVWIVSFTDGRQEYIYNPNHAFFVDA